MNERAKGPPPTPVSGTQGYAQEAPDLLERYESVPFAEVHREVLHLVPLIPGRVVDIGAGTGRDAAALAALGHRVLAVEPTAEMRTQAALLHPSPLIEWLDDSLPDLARLTGRGRIFDLVMLSAVWMHLDADQRRAAMPKVAGLVAKGGTMILSLRHGPVPEGRRMFDVTADETIELAAAQGLRLTVRVDKQKSHARQPGVTWSRLGFAN